MFLRKAALRPVPSWAVVSASAIDALEAQLSAAEEQLQGELDRGYRDMDLGQPHLAEWLAEEVSSGHDELAQSVGYFLAVTVHMAFKEAFGRRLRLVDEASLELAQQTLAVDEELRANDPSEVFESDDVIAMGQPALVDFIQHHFDEAIAQSDEATDLRAFDVVYRALLVEVIALSHAVDAPEGRAPALA